MQKQTYGTVKVLEFRTCPQTEFEDIVEELDLSLRMVDTQRRSLIWESDDIAILERDFINVAFGWLPSCVCGTPWRLVVAVGASPNENRSGLDNVSHDYVASAIVDRLEDALTVDAVLNGEASQPVGGHLVDTVFELLLAEPGNPSRGNAPPKSDAAFAECDDIVTPMYSHRAQQSTSKGLQYKKDGTTQSGGEVNSPWAAVNNPPDLADMDPSDQMRLTIHALALSLLLYAPPLGAFMFVYTMLRDATQVAT